jgi:hypothetical protein
MERLFPVRLPPTERPAASGGEATALGVRVSRPGRDLGGQDQQVEDPHLGEQCPNTTGMPKIGPSACNNSLLRPRNAKRL